MKVKTSVTRAWASVLTGTAATESTAIISSSSQVKVVNRCRTASVAISSAKRSVPMFYSRRNISTSHFSLKQIFKFCVVLVDDEPAEMLEIRERGTWRKSSDKTSRMLGNSSLSDGRQPTDYSVRWCLSVNGRYKREIPPSGGQKKQSVTSRVWLIPLQRRRRRKTIGSGRSLDDNFFQKIQSNQKRRGRRRLLEDDEITLCVRIGSGSGLQIEQPSMRIIRMPFTSFRQSVWGEARSNLSVYEIILYTNLLSQLSGRFWISRQTCISWNSIDFK